MNAHGASASDRAAPGAAPGGEPPVDEEQDELFFGISAARLRARSLWASLLFLLSLGLPYEVIDGEPMFVWQLAPELLPAAWGAAFALPLAGVAILVARAATKRAASLAATVLAALASVAVLRRLGSERAAWDMVALPDSLSDRPAGALLALALAAAAGHLAYRPRTRHATRYVVGAALAAALWFYAWPGRTEAPVLTVLRALAAMPELPDLRFQIGVLLLAFISLWPLGVALASLLVVKHPPAREAPWLSLLATWGFPGLLAMLAYRAIVLAQGSVALLVFLGVVGTVLATVAVLSSAVAVAVEAMFVEHGDVAPASRTAAAIEGDAIDEIPRGATSTSALALAGPGLSPRGALGVAASATALVATLQLVVSRPPEKGTDWELLRAPAGAEELYGTRMASWGRARRNWDFAVRREGGAEGRIELKQQGKLLIEAAQELDPGLGQAVKALVDESDDLDLGGRRWSRLVDAVNEASRKAGLPYYVDPTVLTGRVEGEGLRRHFYVHSYAIESVDRYRVDGGEFATLRVRAIGHSRDAHARLGFSSDASPFALVVLEETERFADDWLRLGAARQCTEQSVVESPLYGGLDACGERLGALVERLDEVGLREAVLESVVRHELQHQIDGPHLRLGSTVLTRLEGYGPELRDRVSREASAYLAGMTASGPAARISLFHLASFVIVNPRSTYGLAAIVVFEALGEREVVRDGKLDADAFWRLFHELSELDDGALVNRAKESWASEYGTELPEAVPLGG